MPKDPVQCLSLNLNHDEAKAFRQVVQNLGFQRGKSTDLSGFGRAIANQDLIVLERENKISSVIDELIKVGRYELAMKIAEIAEAKTKLPKFLNQIRHFIFKQQPFRLEYLDVTGKQFFFDCSFAQISTYEAREYLEVRQINSLGPNDSSVLQNNNCLRIDQIPESSQITALGDVIWQELQNVDVEYSLKGNLILEYIPEPEDSLEKISIRDRETKLIVRTKITNNYWFIRKIIKLGGSAEILSPKFLRTQFKDEIQKISKLYS